MQMKEGSKKKLNINIDRNLADETQSVLDELGLNQTTAIVMYFKQIVSKGKIPFAIELTDKQKASRELRKSIKDIPIEKLQTKKQIEEWFNDKSQDY
ncbi:type II toxin-antitoxin system RelB/DinJ family antitoxin [Lactobacillus halodurans]|uniref:Type II toxin-antitoxin system RelB/DinJ family antitoxin n=1 Tax=Companilactobacillus halodurans TaxID=2584183 RepID=A0A5P0ZQE5_9LACO|nr:type II toxin-antitoxin system RelB/DinJ family antitoxin [Companilactobacillus halodurans]MQS76091.1 type II toxin-antitoxin system RelB/DinJ family antitoxin [Companilactobacillus halodurans]